MNNVLVIGGSKHKRIVVDHAMHWYIKKHLPKYRNLEITIQIKKMANDYHGLCYKLDKKEFIINISNELINDKLLIAVFHECVHIQQNLKSKLKQIGFSLFWEGVDHKDTEYDSQPWEKEARQQEKILLKSYKLENPQ